LLVLDFFCVLALKILLINYFDVNIGFLWQWHLEASFDFICRFT
jgi:hypothetical protein